MKKEKYESLNIPIKILIAGVIWVLTFSMDYEILAKTLTYKIKEPVPEWLPIVVFSSNTVDVVKYGEIAEYKENHQNISFLVPQGKKQYFNRELVKLWKKKGIDSFPEFTVKQLSVDEQSIKLGFYGDGETVVWYKVSDKSVVPFLYRIIGPGFAFLFLPFHVFINFIIGVLLYFLWPVFVKIKRHIFKSI